MKGRKEGRRPRTITFAGLSPSLSVAGTPPPRRSSGLPRWRGRCGRVGENSGGELSTIPGHKSTCTYRIASESFLYIPANVSSNSSLPCLPSPRDPPIRCRHERLHVPFTRRSSSRISPIDLSNRSRVVPTHATRHPLPSISLVWTDIFKMIPADAGSWGKPVSPSDDSIPANEIGYTKNNPCPFYQGILLYRDILI